MKHTVIRYRNAARQIRMSRKLCLSAASLAAGTRSEATARLSLGAVRTAREERRQSKVQVQSSSERPQTTGAPLDLHLDSVQKGSLQEEEQAFPLGSSLALCKSPPALRLCLCIDRDVQKAHRRAPIKKKSVKEMVLPLQTFCSCVQTLTTAEP